MLFKSFTHLATLCQATVHFMAWTNIPRALQERVKFLTSSNTLFDAQSTNIFESRPQTLKRDAGTIAFQCCTACTFPSVASNTRNSENFSRETKMPLPLYSTQNGCVLKNRSNTRSITLDDFAQGYFFLFFSRSDFDLCREIDTDSASKMFDQTTPQPRSSRQYSTSETDIKHM